MRTFDAKHYLLEIRLKRKEVPSFAEYPFSLAAVNRLDSLVFHPSVTFLVSENGTGKSTLLEAIAVAWGFNAEGGSQNFMFATRSSHSELHRFIELRRGLRRPRDGYFLRAESFVGPILQAESLIRNPLTAKNAQRTQDINFLINLFLCVLWGYSATSAIKFYFSLGARTGSREHLAHRSYPLKCAFLIRICCFLCKNKLTKIFRKLNLKYRIRGINGIGEERDEF